MEHILMQSASGFGPPLKDPQGKLVLIYRRASLSAGVGTGLQNRDADPSS